MKAMIVTSYGSPDVLALQDRDIPTPQPNQIRVKVSASSIGYGDLTARNFRNIPQRDFNMPAILWLLARFSFGFMQPNKQILGAEYAGVVESVGSEVTRFRVGDAVFGYLGASMGAHAEYVCVSQDALVAHKPASLTDEEAACLPYGALTALNLLRSVNIQAGQKVLILGASGSIGSAALQLAKHYGAEVTGVCGTPRVEMVRALGADKVIDYTREDFTQNGETYDVIFDVLGRGSFARSLHSLKPNGRYLCASFKMNKVWQMLGTSIYGDKKLICALSSETLDDLLQVRALAEAGVLKPIVDRSYPLAQAADAHRYAESGAKRGTVVLSMGQAAVL